VRPTQATERELERASRSTVDPLQVVDREHRAEIAAEDRERAEERGPERARIRRTTLRLAEEQGSLQSSLLRSRKHGQHLVGDRLDQIRERHKTEAPLGLYRPRDEHAPAGRKCRRGRGIPQRRLSDPRLPAKDDRATIRPLKGSARNAQLLLTPDDRNDRRAHPTVIAPRLSTVQRNPRLVRSALPLATSCHSPVFEASARR
jgi:hypothetical protein